MSYLEQKRNAMLVSAIQSGQLTNLLANCTWSDGYFNTDGTIHAPTTNQERYCNEYIDIDNSKWYAIICKLDNGTGNGLFVARYDSNGDFLSRINSGDINGMAFAIYTFRVTNTDKVRIATKTYGSANIILCELSEIDNLIGPQNYVYVN